MEFVDTFWALVPAVVAIILALITKEAYSSLFIGILVGALLIAVVNPVTALDTVVNQGLVPAVADNAGIFLFLVLLGMLVALTSATGGAAAFGRWAAKHVKSRPAAMIATFILGVLIFVDDYFNCLTVGSVMRPVTDAHRVSRAKLSYIIDATAAPICMIAPISSWAAAVSGVAADLNVDGIKLFIDAIPFNFYSLMTIVFALALMVMGFDYGPMAKAELAAWRDQELGGLADEPEVNNPKASLWDMLVPILVLIVTCVVGMLYVGGFFGPDPSGSTDYVGNVTTAFGNTDAFVALPWGALIAIVVSVIYLVARRVISFKDAMGCAVKGMSAMAPALIILTLAVSLKNMTSLLGADVFVEGLMQGAATNLYSMLPAVIFLVAGFLAFSTGTSWGTFGILIPIVLPIFANEPTLLIIGISACLAGAVCGDHCSPISDTTIMASAGANVNHVSHVSTQLPYALTVAGISFICYIIAGFTQNAVISLISGTILTLGTLLTLRATLGKKNHQAYQAWQASAGAAALSQ